VVTAVAPGLSLERGAILRELLRRFGAKERSCSFRQDEALGSFDLRIEVEDGADALKASLFAEGKRQGLDLAFQPDALRWRKKRLLVADMDSTLSEIEMIDELARMHGVVDRVAPITERAMRGELSFDESLRARVALLEGLPFRDVEELAGRLPLTRGAEELVAELRRSGCEVALVSGGFLPGALALQKRLHLDHVFANTLEVAEGRLTGRVVGPIINAEKKALHLEALARAKGLEAGEVVAVGDGANDLPMVQRAGLGVAFRAKPLLREAADAVVDVSGLAGILRFIER